MYTIETVGRNTVMASTTIHAFGMLLTEYGDKVSTVSLKGIIKIELCSYMHTYIAVGDGTVVHDIFNH